MPEPNPQEKNQNPTPPEYMKQWEGKSLQDVAQAHHELSQKLGEQGTELGTLRGHQKLVERINELGGLDAVEYWAKYGAAEFDKQEKARKAGPPKSEGKAGGEGEFDPAAFEAQFDGWDQHDAKTQALRMFKAVFDLNQRWLKDNVLGFLNTKEQEFVKRFEDTFGGHRREWDLFRRALGLHLKNPKIDVEDLLKRSRDLATADAEKLFEVAAGQITGPEEQAANLKAAVATAVAEAKATWDQEQANREITTLRGGARPGSSGVGEPKNAAEENAAILKIVAGRR
jgi:hypothetical protein